MKTTQRVRKILSYYETETPGVKANIARFLMEGKLRGTGKMIILPVDQGFEHGPARSFASNPAAYDPAYHPQLALDAGLSGYAAPLGMLECVADTFAGQLPLVLKMNSANSLSRFKEGADQAVTASVDDALRLGCSAIGFTIYPGSDAAYDQFEELRDLTLEAKSAGLATIVWSYPRGGSMTSDGETAVDIVAYGAHMACMLGANIVKVKLPTDFIELKEAKKVYEEEKIDVSTLSKRVEHVVKSCFDGRRIVIFSGGGKKGLQGLYDDAQAIQDGGGNGSIIGRNVFQRPREEALEVLGKMIDIFKGQ
ncbi:MAG TPA: class I fructose-bisphosphate aldolase [Rhodospirillaceae bacterium]|nr:fructose-bisphosphate aldolase [Alphaproteobacteria bacterium]OUT41864.1 MAG: fructose-bisphosphate aldolase [Micavibrio sp. TMED2]HCI46297.1 class I fructose-bisphosphate aldolase [Rhodospirillaceae bacterium]MAS46545.1 fructose-bisphosphate aldolase [Alphaproteobacteria bacterium]MAX94639.1 fructose-bisphosphate aldolase [Alphaproteobacteria bacterium]|tara:strand:+ start:3056 stop:3982 length:927 start_codon:yes stop_codon:yes gene_type:complete